MLNTPHLVRRMLLAGALTLTTSVSAHAGLEICNKTNLQQSVAIGYKGDTDWTSEGWWNIKPGDCVEPVSGKLVKRYYYYHARSDGGGFRGQNYAFCTQSQEFTIVGDTDCAGRGFEESQFREIDTGETSTSFTLTLVDAGGAETPAGARGPGGGNSEFAALPAPAVTETPAPLDAVISPGQDSGADGSIVQSVNELPRTPDLNVRPNDMTTDLPAGEHGTPFTAEALFQGCELEGGRAYCSFHSDGIKMRAFHSGPTPDALFYTLEEMPLNTPVLLTGDQAELRDLHAAVVFRAVQLRPGTDPFADLRRSLQGDWESTANRTTEITIHGSELYERQSGEFKTTRFLQLAETCEGLRGSGPVLLKTTLRNKRVECFQISKPNRRSLTLTPVKGGNALRFRKIR